MEATPSTVPPSRTPTESRLGERLLVFIAVAVGLLLSISAYSPRFTKHPVEFRPGEAALYRVDLNRADRAELQQVPGIGPGKAQAIIAHRNAVGGFQSVDDLVGVKGIGSKTLDQLKPHVVVEGSTVLSETAPAPVPGSLPKLKPGDSPIDVNRATVADFQRLPGIGPTLAGRMMAAKPFVSVEDLRRVKGIGAKTLEAIRPFVVVDKP